jgi:hypothetical protein
MASVYFGCFCFQVFDGILLHGKLPMKHEDNFWEHYKVDEWMMLLAVHVLCLFGCSCLQVFRCIILGTVANEIGDSRF